MAVTRSINFECEQRDPVKFEAGQVVQSAQIPGKAFLVVSVEPDRVHCERFEERPLIGPTFSIEHHGRHLSVLFPAPRIGDTWTSGESVARISADGDGRCGSTNLRIVSEGEPFVGDVVAVARRLWEGGYHKVPRDIARGETIEVEIPLVPWSEAHANSRTAYEKQVRFCNDAIDAILGDASRSRENLPCAGDVYETDNGTIVELRERCDRLYTHVLQSRVSHPVLLEAQRPQDMAELLREHGYRYKYAVPSERECEDMAREAQRERLGEDAMKWDASEAFSAAQRRMLYPTRVDRATGDDMRKFAEPHDTQSRGCEECGAMLRVEGHRLRCSAMYDRARVVPELRAGVVVRRVDERLFGIVESTGAEFAVVKWHGDDKVTRYDLPTVRDHISAGRWRIVTPDVTPLASLARAVAAIFERPDLATSRRYIDTAIATLRGEPFARAIAASLVAASDEPLKPRQIAELIRGARAHERRRSEVAPGRRALTESQLEACWAAAHYESESQWSRRLSEVYERARSL